MYETSACGRFPIHNNKTCKIQYYNITNETNIFFSEKFFNHKFSLVEQSYPNSFLKPLLLIQHRVLSPVRLCTWMSSASFSGLSLSTCSRHFLVTERSRGGWGDSDLMATRTSTRRCLASLQCEQQKIKIHL